MASRELEGAFENLLTEAVNALQIGKSRGQVLEHELNDLKVATHLVLQIKLAEASEHEAEEGDKEPSDT